MWALQALVFAASIAVLALVVWLFARREARRLSAMTEEEKLADWESRQW